MEIVNGVLDNLKIPLIIWNIKSINNDIVKNGDECYDYYNNSNIECFYTNTLLCKINTNIVEYYKTHNIPNYPDFVNNVINYKISQRIKQFQKNIVFEYVNEQFFCEVHYPVNDDNNVMIVAVYKLKNSLTSIFNIISDKNNYVQTDVLKDACYNIVTIVNDLIDLCDIHKNKLILSCKYFSMASLVDDIYQIIQNNVRTKNITVHTHIDKAVRKMFFGDYDKIKHILINLLSNSIKHTINGSININIQEYNNNESCFDIILNKDKHNVLFKIKDTGCGITNESQIHICRIFNIPTDKHDDDFKLKGFGLYISYYLCKFLNGHIWFKSNRDIGTIFYVLIPFNTS